MGKKVLRLFLETCVQKSNDFGAFVMHGIDSLFNKKNGTDIPGQALYFINKMEARKWVKKY